MTNPLKDLASQLETTTQQLQARIGSTWMRPIRARIGRPTDGAIWVMDGNQPYKGEVFIRFETEEDPLAYTQALRGKISIADILLDRTVEVKKAPNGMYELIGVDSFEDAFYSEGIEEVQAPQPVYNHQLIEQGTLHPVSGALQVRVAPGRFGQYNYAGAETANFGSGTVQDTSAANITIPTTNGQAKAVLVQLDAANSTLEFKQSSEFDALLTLPQADNASLLPTTDSDKYLLGYFKLVKGMTTTSTLTYSQIWNVLPRVSGGASVSVLDDLTDVDAASPTVNDLLRFDGTNWSTLKNNMTATVAPTTGDDSGDGYSVGSRWIDTTNDKEYVCLDSSVGAAVWVETTGTTDLIADTLTLNDGSELTIATGAITVTHSRHIVDTEGDASEDNLDTVSGLAEGEICLISPANGSRHIVIRSAGNITIPGGANIRLSGLAHCALLLGTASGVTAFNLNLSKAVDLNDLYSTGAAGNTTIIHNGTIFIPQVNRVTTINPTTGDDANDGYSIGSWWINISAPSVWFCTDPTVGAAFWVDVIAHASRHERAGSDEIDGDHLDIDFTPTNYTPDTTPSEAANVDDLAAHLYGIDVALGSAGNAYVADGIAFTDPTAQTWTALNQGSGTYTEDTTNKRMVILEDGNGTVQLRGWYATAPTAPYALRIHAKVDAIGATNGLALGFRQNSTQELHLYLLYDSTSPTFRIDKWNTATSFNSTYVSATTLRYIPTWFKIEDNNTNRIISTSIDGVIWSVRHTIGRTDFLTADEIFVGMIVTTNAAYDSEISILSYEEL